MEFQVLFPIYSMHSSQFQARNNWKSVWNFEDSAPTDSYFLIMISAVPPITLDIPMCSVIVAVNCIPVTW